MDEIEKRRELSEFHLLPAARADLLPWMGREKEAAKAYRSALSLATNDVERAFPATELAMLNDKN